jgi:hypothetical protein
MNATPPEVDPEFAEASLRQRLGAILWPSFFAAGIATMVFFAIFDPEELLHLVRPEASVSRGVGYTVGFFVFWLATVSSSVFTWVLLCPPGHYHYRRSLRD